MLVFWVACLVVGVKIKGFYLTYLFFWIIFSFPAIIYYEVPWKILSRALPILEQLDHSMKYERRSILDKSELLVDVKISPNDFDQETENEYLESFQLGDLDKMHESGRRALEELDDEDEDDEEYDPNDEEAGEEIITETQEIEYEYEPEKGSYRKTVTEVKSTVTSPAKRSSFDIDDDEDDEDLNSMLPDESLPSFNEMSDSYLRDSSKVYGGERVMRRRPKARPSIMDYYGERVRSDGNETRKQKTAQDIDETFDFLDEELDKYD